MSGQRSWLEVIDLRENPELKTVPKGLSRDGVELLVDEGVVVAGQKKEEEKKKEETAAAEVEEALATATANGAVVENPLYEPAEPAAPSAFDADVAILRGWRENEPVLELLWPADDDVTTWAGVLCGEAATAAAAATEAGKTEHRVLSLRLSGVGLEGEVPEVRRRCKLNLVDPLDSESKRALVPNT